MLQAQSRLLVLLSALAVASGFEWPSSCHP